jgi:hypothetical protein
VVKARHCNTFEHLFRLPWKSRRRYVLDEAEQKKMLQAHALRYPETNEDDPRGVPRMFTPFFCFHILTLSWLKGLTNSLPSGMSCTGSSVRVLRGVTAMKWFHRAWAND